MRGQGKSESYRETILAGKLVHGEKPITKLFVEWNVYRYVDILQMWNSG